MQHPREGLPSPKLCLSITSKPAAAQSALRAERGPCGGQLPDRAAPSSSTDYAGVPTFCGVRNGARQLKTLGSFTQGVNTASCIAIRYCSCSSAFRAVFSADAAEVLSSLTLSVTIKT